MTGISACTGLEGAELADSTKRSLGKPKRTSIWQISMSSVTSGMDPASCYWDSVRKALGLCTEGVLNACLGDVCFCKRLSCKQSGFQGTGVSK